MSDDVYVSEWAWSDNPVQLIQSALSLSINKKCHRTFYSSRCSGDYGEEAYKRLFTLNRIFGSPAFFDTVTLFDVDKGFLDEKRIIEHYSRKEFEELYLCRLPHPRG
ncbi:MULTISPECIES: hypothetical protein [Xenorhabdus]|uniref:hypothetical protein n=1 Tax=Xenorhabdus TaxID=626 RepID=UPI0012E09ED0|nr:MULTISPECIES: hypothetical protein [Xenorhabdus]